MAEPTRHRQSSTSSSPSAIVRLGSIRRSNPDVFSDDHALDQTTIIDAFRPSISGDDLAGGNTAQSASTRRSLSTRHHNAPERNSSLLSHPDGTRLVVRRSRPVSLLSHQPSESTLDGSVSRASTTTMPRTQSPYQGATGPSHPYAMYTQDTFIRTPSTNTTSTAVRPRERSYAGPSGPSQPYAMYWQNTMPEDGIGSVQGLRPPPSAGLVDNRRDFRRRLGPEGEDADDLIGPDGYTEQLPPYTRYPDDIPPKSGAPGPASILSAQREESDAPDGIPMNPFETRESLPEHMDEQNQSPISTIAVASNESPQKEDRGGGFKERVKSQGRKKACFGRMPLWLIALLVLLVIAVLAGILGGVIGHAHGERQAKPTATTTAPPVIEPEPEAA